MKTYDECERETRATLDRAISESERGNLALRLELAVNLAASNAYQIELTREHLVGVEITFVRDANVAEMHQLLERMEGK